MVTYDLDQAQQLDWVLHLSDDGRLQRSCSSEEFFADDSLVQQLKKELKIDP